MLDRNSPVPMYCQVKDEIVRMIHSGVFAVGDKVYTESEICQQYSVSPITAKRVLNELAREGYITRHPGRGSFVASRKPISHVLRSFYSFTEEVRRQGMTPSHKLVRLEPVAPTAECAEFFGLAPGERVLLVQRQRYADGELIVLDYSFLHGSLGEKVTTQALASASLYEILQAEGVRPDKAVETFGAAAVDEEAAGLLGLAPGSAVLKVNRQTFAKGVPVEYNYRYYKPEKYNYQIVLDLDT